MGKQNINTKKILVVDDEDTILMMLETLLSEEGYAVATAEDCESAFQKLDKSSYDLLIADILLGKKTGIDLLEHVKEQEMDIPVIMMTGQPTIDSATHSVRLGAFDYLRKPIEMELLLNTTRKAIQHKELLDRKKQLELENRKYRDHLEDLVKKRTTELEITNEQLKEEIAERKKAEENLQRYRKIVSASKEDMCFVDRNFQHLAVNQSYLETHSKSREEMLELRVKDLLDDNVYAKFVKPKLERCLEGEVVKYKGWFTFPGLGKRYRIVSYYPYIENDGEISGIYINSSDITDQKKAEEEVHIKEKQLIQADKISSLGILVSGLVREINAPNNAIMVDANLLMDFWNEAAPFIEKRNNLSRDLASRLAEQTPQLIKQIKEKSGKVKRILNQLETFACQDTPDEIQPVDVNNIVRSAVSMVSEKIKEKTTHFDTRYYSDILLVKGALKNLEQVFISVLLNACEALTDSWQSIVISITADKSDNTAVIRIKDEGAGIPEDHIKKILDPFFTTKGEYGGAGLGLSVTHGIVTKHGGTINFESELEKGTTCTIKLPLY